VHGGVPRGDDVEPAWKLFVDQPPADMEPERR
jgi:hypothetical protein